MSLVNLSVKHGRTLPDARLRLEDAVRESQARLGPMIQRVEWSPDRTRVKLGGTGFDAEMWVDEHQVHMSVEVPILGGLLGNPIATGIQGVVRRVFGQLPSR